MLYLVRHAKAGSRHNFSGDDRLRPLNNAGSRQADALVERLVEAGVKHFVSSPYVRCVQTLEPTAAAVGAKVETDERLSEGHSSAEVLELIGEMPDGSAICSHGDVIPETIEALERRGCEFLSEPDWRKGSVWVLDRRTDGQIISAEAWPPPDSSR